MNSKFFFSVGFLFSVLLFISCNNDRNEEINEDRENVFRISCDESFRPVIDAQLQVFQISYPDAKVFIAYKSESECIGDLLVDSVNMVIIAKKLSEQERNFISDSLKLGTDQATVAYDAIAVITHPLSNDSMFTMKEITDLVSGKANKNLIPVFDGLKATSTVRFMIDTVLRGGKLGENVVAAQSSEAVLDYVSTNPDAVGFIGVSWIGNKEDTAHLSFLKKVKIAYLESTDSAGAYVKPFQYNLYTGSYPMVRDLVYVLKDRSRIGDDFANFMENQRGQLIFRRAYLAPAILPAVVRPTELKEEY